MNQKFIEIRIERIAKDCDEDEYAPPWRHRERDNVVRARPYSSAEWTSELQDERRILTDAYK